MEIIRVLYFTQLTITKNVSLKKIIGCVSSIFNVIVDDVKKELFYNLREFQITMRWISRSIYNRTT